MNLAITNVCNRDCPYCFEGAFRAPPRREMSLSDVDALCRFFRIAERAPPACVTLLGGEPTQHPEVLDIVALIQSHNSQLPITLLTNLLCDSSLLDRLLRRCIGMLVHVTNPVNNTAEQQAQLAENFEFLRQFRAYQFSLAVTIVRPDDDFEFLYDLLRGDELRQICNVRLGTSTPGLGFSNAFVRDFSEQFGEKYLEILGQCHRINPQLRFTNECPVNLCLMSEDVFERVEKLVDCLELECECPNMDILPDFSTHWCFAFQDVPELRVDNIFDYPDIETVTEVLEQKYRRFLATLRPQCDFEHCGKLRCRGPCPALNYYRQVVSRDR